jgi:hypothetical protein
MAGKHRKSPLQNVWDRQCGDEIISPAHAQEAIAYGIGNKVRPALFVVADRLLLKRWLYRCVAIRSARGLWKSGGLGSPVEPVHRYTASAQFVGIEAYALFEFNTGFGEVTFADAPYEPFNVVARRVLWMRGKKLFPQIHLKLGSNRLFTVADQEDHGAIPGGLLEIGVAARAMPRVKT